MQHRDDLLAHRFRPDDAWAQLPADWSWGDVAAVAVDAQDRVYVLNRGQYPMGPEHAIAVFAPDGTLLRTFGDGLFRFAHGIEVGPDGAVYTADAGNHVVRKFDADGKLVMTIGTVDVPAATGYQGDDYRLIQPGGGPFNRPTRCALAPNGDLFVSDGYGNARVHHFAPDGTLLASWGEPGDGPGQFNLVHSVWAHTDGRLFVCDRENSRIQVFSPAGEVLAIWTDVVRPQDLCIDAHGNVYIEELGERCGFASFMPRPLGQNRPARVSVFDLEGRLLARLGTDEPCAPGSFFSPHGVCVDSHGNLYVGEVVYSAGGKTGMVPATCHTLQKLVREG